MKKNIFLPGLMIMILSLCTSCTYHTYHFGVANRAATVPDDFGETEIALAKAEQSAGAKYCPDKLEKAKELAHRGAEVYWACHNTESSDLLAQARGLAKEVEGCGPPAPAPLAPAKSSAPVCNLSASPATVNSGQTTTLNWSSQDANKCDIQPGIGPVDTKGSLVVTPQADTTYTLTCFGKGGKATSDASVNVTMPAKEEPCMLLNIEFDFDKAIIKPQYFSEVEKVANFLKEQPESNGIIEGHTDSRGTAAYNLGLSHRRAESVVKMLVEKYGIAGSRLTAKGYGLTKPVASNKTKEGRQRNRRVMAKFCHD